MSESLRFLRLLRFLRFFEKELIEVNEKKGFTRGAVGDTTKKNG
jgi:hypothetical protein